VVADAQLLACRFLVIANGMAACYSLLQGARCLVSILTGGVLINRPMAWAIFSCDQASIYDCHYQLLYFFGRCLYVLLHVCYLSLSSGYCSAIISKNQPTVFFSALFACLISRTFSANE